MKEEKKKIATRTPRVRKTTKTVDKTVETKVKKTVRRKPIKKEVEEDIKVVKNSVAFSLTEVIIIVLITGIVVSIASGLIVYNNYDKLNNTSIVPKSEFDEFYKHYNKILDGYVEEVDKDALIDAAIGGMYNYLGDEYSMYLDEENTNELSEV